MKNSLIAFRFLVLALLALPSCLAAQETVKIIHADEGSLNPDITDAQRLIGSVHLRYKEADMYCDSAYIYPNDDVEAFGNMRIIQGDSLNLRGKYLFVERDADLVQLRKQITLRDKDLTLSTETLDYNLENGIASYYGGGTIVSSENRNRLTSEEGYYDTESEFFHFRKDVTLKSKDYSVYADTLKYSGASETAYFLGPTLIETRDATIRCTKGWFNTNSQDCQFSNGAVIQNGSTRLYGDSVIYNAESGYGEMFCNVEIQDTASDYLVQGDYGWLEEESGRSMVTQRAMLTQIFDGDSLFLRADTLLNLPDSLGRNRIQAYHDVRFFKEDLQGVCDSLTYLEADSGLVMYHTPLLWSEQNQISGDTIRLTMRKGKLHRMYVDQQAFITSLMDSSANAFNQIKGRDMIGYFVDSRLKNIDVLGNGQVVYFPESDEADKPKAIGLNRSDCSDIAIRLEGNQIEEIALLKQVSGAFHPMSKAPAKDFRLDGFSWEAFRRPRSKDDLFQMIQQTVPVASDTDTP